MGRTILRVGLFLLAGLSVIVVGALGFRAWRQHQNAEALAIRSPNGIQESAFIPVGGIEQWISVRGENRANPVLLVLHGGPGSALSPIASVFRAWERDFTIVTWDQRGAGKTYGRNGKDEQPMTVERMTRDGIEVAEYLTRRLAKKKIVAVGLSWGSQLGVLMVKRRPDLFHAYVGTGVVVAKNAKERVLYDRLKRRLEADRDEAALAKLAEIGPPPYRSEHDLGIQRTLQSRYDTEPERNQFWNMLWVALYAPDVSLKDLYDFSEGQAFAGEALYRELLGYDAYKLGPKFGLPVFVFNGDRDLTTPDDLARAWFETLDAPKKEFVILRGGGHSAIITMPDLFLKELKTRVRPLAN